MSGGDVVGRRRVYEGHVSLVELTRPDGSRYAFLEAPRFVAALVLTAEGEAVLVRQARPPLGRELLELPAGGVEQGEDDPAAVRREIAEECRLAVGELIDLGELVSSPGVSSETGRLFLARRCRPAPGAPAAEPVELVALPVAELVARVARAGIEDAKAAAAVGRALARGLI